MKIVIVMGTCRKNGAGVRYLKRVEQAVQSVADAEFEYIWLGDHDIRPCRGCMVCYDRGESACPVKDGYLDAMRVLNSADAAVFYSPTYTLSVSGLMKTFFDRSSYVLHRPYFRGRQALVLTAVEAYGERTALATLKLVVSMMGFSVAGAAGVVNMKYEADPAYRKRVDRMIARQAALLAKRASAGWKPRPTLFELIAFNFQKAAFGVDTDGCRNDKKFWRDAGWADKKARFYCEARIPGWKAALARALTAAARKLGIVPS